MELPAFHPPVTDPEARCPVQSNSTNSYERDAGLLRERAAASVRNNIFAIGTRRSKLAMVQAEAVKASLEQLWPDTEVKIVGMTTGGDQNQSKALYLFGADGKSIWTKELEVALLEGQVDAIVHCLKDMPTELPPRCELGAILEREDPSDALVVKDGLDYKSLDEMPDGSVIGTSSVRRVAQLRKHYPKLKFADVRGAVGTRLAKLDDPISPYSALVLASAGLLRLGLGSRITASVTSPILYHAIGQGALGIEIREGDERTKEIIGALECWKTGYATRAEKAMLHVLEGGCSVPVGAETELVEIPFECPVGHSTTTSDASSLSLSPSSHSTDRTRHAAKLTLHGSVTSLSGTSSVLSSITRNVYSIADAEALGAAVAADLIAGGGRKILQELGKHVKEVGGKELDGKEMPFVGNSMGERSAINTPPASAVARRGSMGQVLDSEALLKSPKRTVFKEGEVCLRPEGW